MNDLKLGVIDLLMSIGIIMRCKRVTAWATSLENWWKPDRGQP